MSNDPSILNPLGPLPEELAIIEPRTVPSIVDWAPEHLRLPAKESPKLAGLFDFDYSPYLIEPCRWFADPYVREITLMACLQGGKTLFTLVCTAWLIENDPGPTMIVMTDENTLHRRMRRLRATFEANRFLMRQLGGKIDNLHIGEPTTLESMELNLAWSNSAAMMADVPVRYVFADEVALWQQSVGLTEVDALSHLRGRQLTFEDQRKLVKISSPENVGDLLDTEFNDGDRCEFWVTCAKCSYSHVMRWHDKDNPGVYAVLDRDKDGDWLKPRDYELGRHVRYLCPSCGKPWSDYARAAAVREGKWLPAGVTMGLGGKIEGEIKPAAYKSAHISGLMVHPRLRSLNQMAAEWVRAQIALKTGSVGKLKRFLNGQVGQPWKEERAQTDEQKLRTHIGAYRTDDPHVPWGVQHITIAVDVHDDWFRVVVQGWGFLFESWQLAALRVETADTNDLNSYAPLLPLLVRPWILADGTSIPPAAVVIDCGYRPSAAKNFCRANGHLVHNGHLLPVRGSPREMRQMYTKIKEDAALTVYELNGLMLKDQLWRMLFDTPQPGGGYWHLPADITGDIVGELCSEHKVTAKGKAVWTPKKEGRDNHSWDASYYNLFAAHFVGIGTLAPLPDAPPPPAPQRPQAKRPEGRKGFLDGLPDLNR